MLPYSCVPTQSLGVTHSNATMTAHSPVQYAHPQRVVLYEVLA